jgi:hypothetical protein
MPAGCGCLRSRRALSRRFSSLKSLTAKDAEAAKEKRSLTAKGAKGAEDAKTKNSLTAKPVLSLSKGPPRVQ